ncbi:uncharacterized protein EI97DRAFT_459789 [Westerdykella ornata]|uniref:Uncharacterized protein n=1 Tax=Westerdykella ornata TaxID=318751 RepID=A0A6A6JHU2_WESOR|nr:uncharacterized protein EI97DRAFT_459789 [Westerdykella ornata]KAF2274819.1 hypothetical protein EI97DRAFT_459789 [Westerdykella ornata]
MDDVEDQTGETRQQIRRPQPQESPGSPRPTPQTATIVYGFEALLETLVGLSEGWYNGLASRAQREEVNGVYIAFPTHHASVVSLDKLAMQQPRFASMDLELTPWATAGGFGESRRGWLIFEGDAECESLHAGGAEEHTLCNGRGLRKGNESI